MSVATSSQRWFARAERALPAGVSSPVRAFGAVGGTPIVVQWGEGAHLIDVDGRRYLDFVQSFGPLIAGHAHRDVVAAVARAAAEGTTFGAPHPREIELAERIVAAMPGAAQVRFVSSGTEATMTAIRLARGVTGRERIVKFAGCYHGHGDALLVEAGSGGATFGVPTSAGVPAAVAAGTLVLQLDDDDGLRQAFAEHGEQIAAAIIEPLPANHGLLPQRRAFLELLAAETARCGALLIFDEVITGFRLAAGGIAEFLDLRADLYTYGKVLGGGLPVGALAGSPEHLAALAPSGPVYQAGTLAGNPLAMAAGLATLDVLARSGGYARLEQLGARLERGAQALLARTGWPVQLVRAGSLLWWAFGSGEPPRRPAAIAPDQAERYRVLFHACLRGGVYLAPSAYEVGFLSTAHTEADIDRALEVLEDALAATFS